MLRPRSVGQSVSKSRVAAWLGVYIVSSVVSFMCLVCCSIAHFGCSQAQRPRVVSHLRGAGVMSLSSNRVWHIYYGPTGFRALVFC